MQKSDEELMVLAKKGDTGAFEMLYERYKNRVYGFAFRMLGRRFEAEEVVAEAFTALYSKIKNFDSSRLFSAWIFAIARNKCIDIMRKRGRQVNFSAFFKGEGSDFAEEISIDNSPDKELQQQEIAEYVAKAIASLPIEQKTAIILREYESMNYEEIALVMDCSIAKVKILLFRAREALAEKLMPISKELGYVGR